MRLRSVELELPDKDAAVRFLVDIWGLIDAGSRKATSFLRATGDHPYVLSLAEAAAPAVASVTFSGTRDEVDRLFSRVGAAGVAAQAFVSEFDEPGAPCGFLMRAREGQIYRFVAERRGTSALPKDKDKPVQITHAVMNAVDREACTRFALDVLGFRLSDVTRIMSFVRCDRKHHAIAFADAGFSSLNHIAFEMVDLDAVMRGIGRMKDNGIPCAWGPGRHGPGNNVFGYFVAPFDAVIEYTSEIQEVDDSYRVGHPEDWDWPPNRTDHWGVSGRDSAKLVEAERKFRFRPA